MARTSRLNSLRSLPTTPLDDVPVGEDPLAYTRDGAATTDNDSAQLNSVKVPENQGLMSAFNSPSFDPWSDESEESELPVAKPVVPEPEPDPEIVVPEPVPEPEPEPEPKEDSDPFESGAFASMVKHEEPEPEVKELEPEPVVQRVSARRPRRTTSVVEESIIDNKDNESDNDDSPHHEGLYVPIVWDKRGRVPDNLPDVRDHMIKVLGRIVLTKAADEHESEIFTKSFVSRIIREYLDGDVKNTQMFVSLVRELIAADYQIEILGAETANVLKFLELTEGKI